IYAKLREAFPEKWNTKLGQLLWEYRPSDSLPYLMASLNDATLTEVQRGEVLDALAAMAAPEAGNAVATLLASGNPPPELAEKAFAHLSRQLFSEWIDLRHSPSVQAVIRGAFDSPKLRAKAVELAGDLGGPAYGKELLVVAKSAREPEELRVTAIEALGRTRDRAYVGELERLYRAGPLSIRAAAVRATGEIEPQGFDARCKRLILSQEHNQVRTA